MDKADTNIQLAVREELQNFGNLIQSDAEQDAPILTGFLRSTIYAKVKEWVLFIGAWADYAKFQEFGTRYIEGLYFLSNNIQKHWSQIREYMARAVNEAIRRTA
ncbi:MAG: hypothetical protein PHU43_03405 [Candidatus Bipolaricaulis sp.]|nr:hypothetical protein [Candidatus Bipolaricaulis sp.]